MSYLAYGIYLWITLSFAACTVETSDVLMCEPTLAKQENPVNYKSGVVEVYHLHCALHRMDASVLSVYLKRRTIPLCMLMNWIGGVDHGKGHLILSWAPVQLLATAAQEGKGCVCVHSRTTSLSLHPQQKKGSLVTSKQVKQIGFQKGCPKALLTVTTGILIHTGISRDCADDVMNL